jgi:hypothetical protein
MVAKEERNPTFGRPCRLQLTDLYPRAYARKTRATYFFLMDLASRRLYKGWGGGGDASLSVSGNFLTSQGTRSEFIEWFLKSSFIFMRSRDQTQQY